MSTEQTQSESYSDSSSSLQSELVRKFVRNGAAITHLPLHLPVPQTLVLQEQPQGIICNCEKQS